MKPMSILLTIDGSAESRSAAYIAWQLAKKTGSSITAQHVIDSLAVWKFLSFKSAGFIGSGPYMEACERIKEALHAVAESLFLAYNSQAEGQGLNNRNYIDEGDFVSCICERAKEHDLVIVGHSLERTNDFYLELGKMCSAPVLVIQKSTMPWSKVCILLTDETVNEDTIWDISEFGSDLGLPTELYLHSSYGKEHTLRWANKLACVRGLPVAAIRHAYDGYAMNPGTLMVPVSNSTTDVGANVITDYLMDNSAVLIWPSEYIKMSTKEKPTSRLAPKDSQRSRMAS